MLDPHVILTDTRHMRTSEACEVLNVRPAELARRLGVSRQRVHQWGGIIPAVYAIRLRVSYPRVPLRPEDYAEQPA